MPLLDHFRPPLSRSHPWRAFHGAWAAALARLLNAGVLPEGYYAVPFLDRDGPIEIDVAALRDFEPTGPDPPTPWVPAAPATQKTPVPVTRLRTIQRVSRLVDTMTGASDNDIIRRFEGQICRLPAMGYGTLEFGMEGDRLKSFLDAARAAMAAHLDSAAAFAPVSSTATAP